MMNLHLNIASGFSGLSIRIILEYGIMKIKIKQIISWLKQIALLIKWAGKVFQGFRYWIFKTDKVEKLSKARLRICKECQPDNMAFCEQCGCPLTTKTRSPEAKCPLEKW